MSGTERERRNPDQFSGGLEIGFSEIVPDENVAHPAFGLVGCPSSGQSSVSLGEDLSHAKQVGVGEIAHVWRRRSLDKREHQHPNVDPVEQRA